MNYRLDQLFKLQMGKTPARANLEYWDGTNKWVSISDLSGYDKYVTDTKECISDLGVSESGIKVVPKNTVIMSFKLSIGKTAITTDNVFTNEAIMAFIDKGVCEINTDYLYYLFSGMDWNKGTNKAVLGLTLNKATLSKIEIDIPDLITQNEVVKKLDLLSNVIQMQKQSMDKLDELVKSRFVEMFGDPVENDMEWDMAILDTICDGIGDGLHGTPEYEDNSGYPFINGNNLIDGKITITSTTKFVSCSTYEKHRIDFTDNCILLSINGTLGKVAYYHNEKIMLGKSACYINLKSCVNKTFVFELMRTPFFLRFLDDNSTKSTIKNVGLKAIRGFKLILPPIDVQNQFADFVTKIEQQKATVQKSIEKLEILKKSLMQDYFG